MPAIVITSNREQELPTAFKGRCIYHYIQFPEPEMMEQILKRHFPEANQELIDPALKLFYQLRSMGLERSPSTRELINWFKYLQNFDLGDAIDHIEKKIGMGVLIKTQRDLERVERLN